VSAVKSEIPGHAETEEAAECMETEMETQHLGKYFT